MSASIHSQQPPPLPIRTLRNLTMLTDKCCATLWCNRCSSGGYCVKHSQPPGLLARLRVTGASCYTKMYKRTCSHDLQHNQLHH